MSLKLNTETHVIPMIDLHCHMLPAIDDGAVDLEMALRMARIAVEDGIHTVACTPHIYPGLYPNDADGIAAATQALREALQNAEIALELTTGADTHIAPDLLAKIAAGKVPTLGGSRYLLLEPPHHVEPPGFLRFLSSLRESGIVPVITHPERLSWIEVRYENFVEAVRTGSLMQVTSGSLTGRFGSRAKYWADRMLDEGLIAVLATDAHSDTRRAPLLAEARDVVAARLGDDEAVAMTLQRPAGILANASPEQLFITE